MENLILNKAKELFPDCIFRVVKYKNDEGMYINQSPILIITKLIKDVNYKISTNLSMDELNLILNEID